MPTTTKGNRWRVIARSERGASHIRNNLRNQDVVKSFTSPDGTTPVILAVADGHGSPKSFRSDIGALFAAESAVLVCSEFLGSIRDASASLIKNSAEQQIPRRIIDKWKQRVEQHFNANPFSPEELKLAAKERYPVAYGSTILLAAVSDQFLLFFQLGDGEMLVVSDSTGEVTRPIPRDEALIANETTSLCMEDPLPEFRFRFQYVRDTPPGVILLSTDGYPNSFRSQEDFLKVGTDLLEMLRTDGGDSVEKDLPGWLREASTNGSGDDVTLGIIYRLEPGLGQLGSATSAESIPSTPGEKSAGSASEERAPVSAGEQDAAPEVAHAAEGTLGSGQRGSEEEAVTSQDEAIVASEPTKALQEQPSGLKAASSPEAPAKSDSRQMESDTAAPAEPAPATAEDLHEQGDGETGGTCHPRTDSART